MKTWALSSALRRCAQGQVRVLTSPASQHPTNAAAATAVCTTASAPAFQPRRRAFIEVLPDYSVNLMVGCADISQGSTSVIAQIAAEELGLEI